MPLDKRIKKALLNNRNQMKTTRVNNAYKYAQEHKIKVTKKQIKDYIKEIDTKTFTKVNGRKVSKQFVFNFIGGWFADIGFNRNKEMGEAIDGKHWLKQFVLFVNGNSGWAKVYETPNKTQSNVSVIIRNFINDMERGGYPVKKIITDNDGAFDSKSFPITKITSEVADDDELEHKNHRLFSRIDTFMSHLRRYAWNEYNSGSVDGKKPKICDQPASKELYIPLDTINRFVWEWNQRIIPVIRCSRTEMMEDENLEKAYICAALYGNQMKESAREQFKAGAQVRLKTNGRLFGNRQEQATGLRAGTYTIQKNVAGHYVGVDGEGREVHFNADEVDAIMDPHALDEDIDELEGVDDEINDPKQWEHQVTKFSETDKSGMTVPKKKNMPKEKSEDDIDLNDMAKNIAIQKQLNELDMGLFPEFGAEKLYKSAKLILEKLKEIDQARWSRIVDEGHAQSKKLSMRAKAKIRAGLKQQYAKERDPYRRQDIPELAAERIGHMLKLAQQRAARKNYEE